MFHIAKELMYVEKIETICGVGKANVTQEHAKGWDPENKCEECWNRLAMIQLATLDLESAPPPQGICDEHPEVTDSDYEAKLKKALEYDFS